MLERLNAIALGRVRYSDRHDIISFYSLERGRITFLHPTPTSGRKRRAMPVMPLSLVEINANIHQNREIQQPGKISLTHPLSGIYMDPLKNCMAIFLGDFLNRLLREASRDKAMWEFLKYSVLEFERARRGTPNFHIAFPTMLSRYAGIMPDTSGYAPGRCFDMAAGSYVDIYDPRHLSAMLDRHDSDALPMLMRMDYSNARAFRFNRKERRHTLDLIIRYYDLYFPGIANLRSIDVLHEIFS